uniref:Lipid desaturase domain-containing protein n=1 Tax=Kalanchoe fedtschenkoi TaxID=63787 RepID=A0A7N0UB50_KALFE
MSDLHSGNSFDSESEFEAAKSRSSYWVPVNDPSLKSTWGHRAWVAGACMILFTSIYKSVSGLSASSWMQPIMFSLAGYVVADLASGIYHWAIDNYGSATTPILGRQIEAFQGHHMWPILESKREMANNLHISASAVILGMLPIVILLPSHYPNCHAFCSAFSVCALFCQQFHAWAHCSKSSLPVIVVALQDMGLLVSRSAHAAHHRPPYDKNYCIVSGMWNKTLETYAVFRALELVLFKTFGVRPRSWN